MASTTTMIKDHGPQELPAVVIGRTQSFVSPWRRELFALAEQMLALVEEHAEPETRYRALRDVTDDMNHAMLNRLRMKYGCVFDPIFDRLGQRHGVEL